VTAAIEGSSIFHYHGHIHYDPSSALDSVMALNKKAYNRLKNRMRAGAEFLTARDLFKTTLAVDALATIIGCSSGVATISSLDDILGFATALFYVGVSAVVSTLWPLDEDGAVFSKEFYNALFQQLEDSRSGNSIEPIAVTGPIDNALDLAKAFRTAVLRMRQDPVRQDLSAPYHWASFTLNVFWLSPTDLLYGSGNGTQPMKSEDSGNIHLHDKVPLDGH
jgi:CHAT domain-containing protein